MKCSDHLCAAAGAACALGLGSISLSATAQEAPTSPSNAQPPLIKPLSNEDMAAVRAMNPGLPQIAMTPPPTGMRTVKLWDEVRPFSPPKPLPPQATPTQNSSAQRFPVILLHR